MTHAESEEQHRVTTLELFFDLVFVFTLTQLTALLADQPTPEGVLRVVLVFAVLWYMYGGYAWLTNAAPPDRMSRRLPLVLGMAGFLVCALAVPRAYTGGGLAFGLGYLVVVLVHAALYASQHPGPALRFGSLNLVATGLVLAAGLVTLPAGYALWAAAIVLQFLIPHLVRVNRSELRIRASHFVERHGLLLIVALGESVIAIGIATEGLPLDLALFGAAVLGLALAAALWWSYFAADEAAAERALAAASPDRRPLLAINGYYYAFVPMLLGIVATAAGVKKTLGHLPEPLPLSAAALLGGGIAGYLLGEALFRRMLGIGGAGNRLVAAAAALAVIALGLWVAAVAQLAVLVAVLVGMVTLDARRRVSSPRPARVRP